MTDKISPREFWELAVLEAGLSGMGAFLAKIQLERGDISTPTFHTLVAVCGMLTSLGVANALWETHKAKRPPVAKAEEKPVSRQL